MVPRARTVFSCGISSSLSIQRQNHICALLSRAAPGELFTISGKVSRQTNATARACVEVAERLET